MIAKFSIIALLAVVAAGAPAADCGYKPVCELGVAPVAVAAAPVAVPAVPVAVNAPVVKRTIARGKYPVALKNCGPPPERQIPVYTTRCTAPVQEKPTIRLPCKIPAPRVVAHSCTCYKTIVRPRVHQHILTVPSVQRYIETTHKPVVEQIEYEAVPVNCYEPCNDRCDLVAVEGKFPAAVEPVAVPVAPCVAPAFQISRVPVFAASAPVV